MQQPVVIPATLGNFRVKWLDNFQSLLAGMQFQQGVNLEYWFSRILPFVEVSQKDKEAIGLQVKNDYYTVFDDKENATVFFHLQDPQRENAHYSSNVEYKVSMFIWYNTKFYSRDRVLSLIHI
jgi:hypothetical protein